MRKHVMAACLLMATPGVCAQTHEKDSLRVISLQKIEIISTRATEPHLWHLPMLVKNNNSVRMGEPYSEAWEIDRDK